MSTNDQALPREALFEPDGHLTEVALTCIADGEHGLVSSDALAHLDGCDGCTARLGEEALLSVSAGSALAALTRAPAAQTAVAALVPAAVDQAPSAGPIPTPRRLRRPLPIAAIAAALVLAALTALPSLVEAVRGGPGTVAGLVTSVQFMLRVGSAFVRVPWAHGSAALVVKCAVALACVAVGLAVARIKSRGGSWQEGGV